MNDASGAVLEGYADGLGDAGAHFVVAAYRTNASLRFGALAGILLLQAADDANDLFGARGRRRALSHFSNLSSLDRNAIITGTTTAPARALASV